jgi:DNA-binding HxlR family transcriptional regulator
VELTKMILDTLNGERFFPSIRLHANLEADHLELTNQLKALERVGIVEKSGTKFDAAYRLTRVGEHYREIINKKLEG